MRTATAIRSKLPTNEAKSRRRAVDGHPPMNADER
jgi:hypothetical protein